MILYQIFVGVILSIVFRGNGAVKEKATNLDLPIEKLSTISQMLSGISISNGFYTGHTDIYDVAAELLNMESGRSLYKFLKLDIDSMANGLQEFFDSIKNVQNISIDNPQEIENALRFLVEIKQYREILKPGGIEEKSAGKIRDELNRLHDAVYRLVEQSNPTYAAQLKAHLVTMFYVYEKDKLSLEQKVDFLKKLRHCNEKIFLDFSYFNDHCSFYLASLARLYTFKDQMSPYLLYGNMAKNFSVNFNRFDLLRNYSASIIQTSTVALTLNSQKTMLEFDVKLKSLSQKVSELVKLNSLMSYNLISYENLLEAHEFFKQWSELKFVESNPTSGAFKHGKYPFRFLSGVLKSRETWTKLANDSPTIPSFSNTIEQSSKLNKYYEPEKLFTSLPKCVEKLKALKTQPDFDKLSIIDSVVNTFHENARELHDKMSNVHGEFSKVYTDEEAKKIHNILPYDSSSDYENTTLVNKWWDRINDEIKFEPLIEMLDKFIVITKPVKTFVPFLATIKQFTEEDIPQILGSFDGTNILDVIDCIQSSSVDVFSEAIRYNQQVTLLKSKEAEIQYIVDYFKNLTNFQQNIKNSIDKALAEKPKKTREIESLLKIKNIHRVSQEFGGGVQALKAIQQILQKEESVLALANANQDIVRFINDDPFNNKTMKRLKDMITDVKKFNDRVGSRTFNSLSDLWIVFHEAKKIGFHRELDVDAVAKKLSGSTTPNGTEEFLNHLKEVGSLNLNFNMHLTRVLVASMMMKEVNGTLEKIFNPKVEVVKVEKVGVIGIGMSSSYKWYRFVVSHPQEFTLVFLFVAFPVGIWLFDRRENVKLD